MRRTVRWTKLEQRREADRLRPYDFKPKLTRLQVQYLLDLAYVDKILNPHRIRRRWGMRKELAEKFGVSPRTITSIWARERRTNITRSLNVGLEQRAAADQR